MRHLTVRVLGPFEVTIDSAPVTGFAYAKVRALLAFLAVEAHHPHPRAELATLLWPEQPERTARANLSKALTTLRTALDDSHTAQPLVLSDAQVVQLDPQCAVDLDLSRFLGLLALCDAHAHRSWRTCAGCAEHLHEALDLYRGSFLVDLPIADSAVFEEWAAAQREHLHQRALSLVERLVDRAQWRTAYAEALTHAQQLLGLEPLLDANQRACMRLLALNGETAAALAQYRQFQRLLAQELAAEPEDATTALYEQIRRGETTGLQPPQAPFRVPMPPTPLVGRGDELAAMCARLRDMHGRLLTITGAGGIGKTRLAIEAAHALRYDYEDGVSVVELAALADAALAADTIARELGVPERLEQGSGAALRKHLQDKHLLLVLDNFEHVIAAAPLLAELLAGCPALTVLVTSRAPLKIRAEQQYILEPLAEADAVRLFVERAQAAGTNLSADEVDTALYASICRRLDRLPLAIELIAMRARTRSPRELLHLLEQPLEALAQGPCDGSARHRSLRHAIRWSYDLLAAEEQRVFRHLGVFAGGASVEAAVAILGAPTHVLPVLETLVQVSLVQQQIVAAQTRFGLLETICEFALEQLVLCGEAETAYLCHNEYILDVASRVDARRTIHEDPAWAEPLDREHDNALATLAWCAAAGRTETGLRLGALLADYWVLRGYISPGLRALDTLLAVDDAAVPPAARTAALNACGRLCGASSDFRRARMRYEQSLALAGADGTVRAGALVGLGVALWHLGDYPAARAQLEQAIALCSEHGDRRRLASAYNNLGLVQQFAGQSAAARASYQHALLLARETSHLTVAAMTLMNLGNLASNSGGYAAARTHYADALAANRELGSAGQTGDTLLNLGNLSARLGELDAALDYYVEAERLYIALNSQADLGYTLNGRGDIAFQRGDYAQARGYFEQAADLFRTAGDQRLLGMTLGRLGYTAVREGRLHDAATLCAEALTLRRAIGHRAGMVVSLDSGYGELALALGRPAVAARLLGAAAAAREALGQPRSPVEARAADVLETTLRAQLGAANFVAAATEGRAMSLEQVAAFALDNLSPSSIDQPAPGLRIFALGPVHVYRAERLLSPVDWTYAKARELVLLLVLHPPATREQLGVQLWPAASPEQRRQRFSAALAHARTALGRDTEWINLVDGRYRFNRAQPVWIDVEAFEAALFEAQLLLQGGTQNERAAAVLSDAVALYRNDFVSDVHNGCWHLARRDALRCAWLQALLELGELHGTAGRHAQAIAIVQRAVDADAHGEAAHQALIRAYLRAGKRRQAVAQYKRLQAALSELRAAPAPETVALMQSLRHGTPL